MDKYPELTEIANKLGLELIRRIYEETDKIKSTAPSKFQYVLEAVRGKLK